jgi:hypothetical protein
LWLFFGGGDYQFEGLKFLDPPTKSGTDGPDESGDEESTYETVEGVCGPDDEESYVSVLLEEDEVPLVLPDKSGRTRDLKNEKLEYKKVCNIQEPIIVKLLSHDLNYYTDKNFKNPKRMDKKSAPESRGEGICRKILENFFNKPFPSSRPDFLINPKSGRNLELDCYNEELSLALEYNGIQHYDFPNYYHKTHADFDKQLEHDVDKMEACIKAGVYLMIVPYWVPHNKIPQYIEYYLPENVLHRQENEIEELSKEEWTQSVFIPPKNGYI